MVRRKCLTLTMIALVAGAGLTACASPSPPGAHPTSSASLTVSSTTRGAWHADDATIRLGNADAPHTVDVWFDLRCPYCKQFDDNAAATFARWTSGDEVALRLHPLAFLDKVSAGSAYSSRSATALIEVARVEPSAVLPVMSALYGAQPEEGTTGLDDATITKLVARHGVDVSTALGRRAVDGDLERANAQAFSGPDPITGTPTVRVDGETVSGDLYGAEFLSSMRVRLGS